MSLLQLAFNNFKNNVKTYTMFFISMIFSVIVLCNFEVLRYGETIKYLQEKNDQIMSNLMSVITVMLICFMIFFIWYATNIFLTKRKKEIGIYAFMGVEIKTISRLYFLEMMFMGSIACIVGEVIGAIFSKFFQVIVLKVANFELNVTYDVTFKAIIETFVIFMIIFIIFTIKGMISIVRTQVIDLLKADSHEEKVPNFGFWYYIEAITSVLILGYGYYCSTTKNSNLIFPAVICVLVGTYGLYQSLIPLLFKVLSQKKSILYRGENIITLSNLTYRVRRNYRIYALISIIMACTICVLGGAFTTKNSYEEQERQILVYDVAAISTDDLLLPNKDFDVQVDLLTIDHDVSSNGILSESDVTLMKYSDFVQIVKKNELVGELSKLPKQLKDNELIVLERPGTLMTIDWGRPTTQYQIVDKTYDVVDETRVITLGWAVNTSIQVVNDDVYQSLVNEGETIHFYGAKINDQTLANSLANQLEKSINDKTTHIYNGYNVLEKISWLKFVYAVGSFLFLVVMIATGSIIYMKIYHDSSEDKAKYQTLLKIGATKEDLNRVIIKEVSLLYAIPSLLGAITSYFAIGALGDLMSMNLTKVYFIALGVCILIFVFLCMCSIHTFKKLIYKN